MPMPEILYSTDPRETIIYVRDLVKRFGRFVANDHLSFDVYKGEIFGFLGANGAGKTTAIRILCGLSTPTSGQINVAGYDAYLETEKIKKNIGYMSQKFSLYEDLSLEENFTFYGGVYGLSGKQIKEKTNLLLTRLDLLDEKKTVLKALPLGWKQKLAFCVAIMHDPKIVFLDEPTGGVDPITRRQFWDLIYEASHNGITVFVTTHYMDEAEYCERVTIMVDGRIDALDTPANLKSRYQADTMNEVFLRLARNAKSNGV
ncbi:MAG: ABC transporter ATP-binding protein [Bacteroidota bacterium]|nr:ABC transporter ATP-binding protein [Bacteroidota bacterium]